jgi:Kazal-type serine protease inhibitor domain
MSKWSTKYVFTNKWLLSALLLTVISACVCMIIADNSKLLMAQTKPLKGNSVPEKQCGGIANQSCGKGEYCDISPLNACQGEDLPGVCRVMPTSCPQQHLKQVCGCDGKTYSNDCTRLMAQTQKAYEGQCRRTPGAKSTPPVKTCGGILNQQCDRDEYCDITVLNSCDGADLPGVCKLVPKICMTVVQPVCGCNETTYTNDCNRLIAQVQKAHDGKCTWAQEGGDAESSQPNTP